MDMVLVFSKFMDRFRFSIQRVNTSICNAAFILDTIPASNDAITHAFSYDENYLFSNVSYGTRFNLVH